DRMRRMAGMFVAGLLIIALGEWQDLQAPQWWGPLVTMAQAEKMPAWHSQGRFHELPMPSWKNSYLWSVARAYRGVDKGIDPVVVPKSVQSYVNGHAREI